MPLRTFIIEPGTGGPTRRSSMPVPQPSKIPLSTDWVKNAVNHFVHHFVLVSADDVPGFHETLPGLYLQHADSTTYFQKAVQAVAMAHLARVSKMGPRYIYRAHQWYGEAIKALRIALDDHAERTSATALMTAEMLTEYDVSQSK